MRSKNYMGVRVNYRGHGNHVVSTCIHRTTEENKRACLTAIAILEGMTYEELIETIKREWGEITKMELYTASGAASEGRS